MATFLSRRMSSPYIDSCLTLNLYNANGHNKACPQVPKLPLDNGNFFQWLTNKVRNGHKIWSEYGALMIGATNRFDCVPFNTAAVSINWLQYLLQMLEALLRFGHVHYLIPKKMFKFFGVF